MGDGQLKINIDKYIYIIFIGKLIHLIYINISVLNSSQPFASDVCGMELNV